MLEVIPPVVVVVVAIFAIVAVAASTVVVVVWERVLQQDVRQHVSNPYCCFRYDSDDIISVMS